MPEIRYDVLAIGNAIVDVIADCDDAMLAAEGLTNKQIGERLYLSHRTVGTHLYQVFPKLGITSRAALRDALTDDPIEQ